MPRPGILPEPPEAQQPEVLQHLHLRGILQVRFPPLRGARPSRGTLPEQRHAVLPHPLHPVAVLHRPQRSREVPEAAQGLPPRQETPLLPPRQGIPPLQRRPGTPLLPPRTGLPHLPRPGTLPLPPRTETHPQQPGILRLTMGQTPRLARAVLPGQPAHLLPGIQGHASHGLLTTPSEARQGPPPTPRANRHTSETRPGTASHRRSHQERQTS